MGPSTFNKIKINFVIKIKIKQNAKAKKGPGAHLPRLITQLGNRLA
jgi:hypothetical protein